MDVGMKESIGRGFGNLLGFFADQNEIAEFARNTWMTNYFNLFKTLLSTHYPDNSAKNAILGVTPDAAVDLDIYYRKYIIPGIKSVNEMQDKLLEDYLKTCGDDKSHHGIDIGADYMDLCGETNTRLTNPNIEDVCPAIIITDDVFYEGVLVHVSDSGIVYDYSSIPVMTLHPKISVEYKYGKLYEEFFQMNHIERRKVSGRPILEISRKSLSADLQKIAAEYTPETDELSEVGKYILQQTVEKYTDFTVPLIFLGLRMDHNHSDNFISVVHDWFSNNFQSAIQSQRYMRTILDTLFKSPLGKAMLLLNSMRYSVSVFELFCPNSPHNTILIDILQKGAGVESIGNYTRFMDDIPESFETLTELVREEKRAYKRVIKQLVMSVLQSLVAYINSNGVSHPGLYKITDTIVQNLFNACKFYKDGDKPGNSNSACLNLYTTRCELLAVAIDLPSKEALLREIYHTLNLVNPQDVVTVGPFSNRKGLSKVTTGYDPVNNIKEFASLQKNGLVSEQVSLAREIFTKGYSNPVLRRAEFAINEAVSTEDLIKISMESARYFECWLAGKHVSAEAVQFGGMLKNIISETSRLINKRIEETEE